jgi:HD-GYP domain-containing protein (c-di-GMP phosphodiesterase class II)
MAGEDLKTLERASLLHDIGKISIDLDQINKPGPLNPTEWDLIQLHPETGFKILSSIDFLQDEALVVRYHHRRYSEFPQFPGIPSRIRTMTCMLTLADSFDAMTTQRSYNVVRDIEDAKEEIRRCSGSHFDPLLVIAFVETLDEARADLSLPA